MTLKTETNTVAMHKRVRRAAIAAGLVPVARLDAFFEHGQWWIQNLETGAQWSVCDSEGAEGVHTFHGFSFEQVSQGDA